MQSRPAPILPAESGGKLEPLISCIISNGSALEQKCATDSQYVDFAAMNVIRHAPLAEKHEKEKKSKKEKKSAPLAEKHKKQKKSKKEKKKDKKASAAKRKPRRGPA